MKDDNVIDISKELKKAQRGEKIEELRRKASDWWEENKVYVMVAVPVAAGVLKKAIGAFNRHHTAKIEERNKDLRLYDTSLGHYWELRRKLCNDDWVAINRRRNRGESLGEILESLHVLK